MKKTSPSKSSPSSQKTKKGSKTPSAASADAFEEVARETLDLKSLIKMGEEFTALEKRIKKGEALLKELNSQANDYKTRRIPDAMAEAGLTTGEIKLPDGSVIKCEEFVAGTLPKDEEKRKEAIELLASIGGEALIKSELSLMFEKREHNKALDLVGRLVGEGFAPTFQSSVHPQTLLAFVREKLRAGEQVDYEKLGVFVGRKASVKLSREN